MVDGLVALVVTVTYFIAAIALAVGIGLANRRRKKLGTEKSSNTSLLVLAMAITFFISEEVYAGLDRLKALDAFPLTLQMINSAIHAVMCYCMSSQYRDTVKAIFWKKKGTNEKPEVIASTMESSNKPTSASSSSNRKKDGY